MSADPGTVRTAVCSCGRLRAACTGDPVRLSMCHCLECQKRTGSPFGVQARFPHAQVRIEGAVREYARTGEEGNVITFRFCPTCGATLYWTMSTQPDLIAVAVGNFADPAFPAPNVSVFEKHRHAWVAVPDHPRMQRQQTQ